VALSGPELLNERHVIEPFRCGSEPLDSWLQRRALNNQRSGSSRTWVVLDDNDVVAYYASASASILRGSAPKPLQRNQPDLLPAILLSRLAVSSTFQGRGLGAALLKHFMLKALEVRQRVGVRVVLVHAKDANAKSFYEKYDFVSSPLDPLTLMQVLPPLERDASLVL
jgi:GNAT superfamily N-acetyltransferase